MRITYLLHLVHFMRSESSGNLYIVDVRNKMQRFTLFCEMYNYAKTPQKSCNVMIICPYPLTCYHLPIG